jgi:hypothetical protein
MLLGIAIISGGALLYVMNRLWPDKRTVKE